MSATTKIFEDWYAGNTRFTHSITEYKGQEEYAITDDKEVVRLHFGLKGNYDLSFTSLGRGYALIGGHYNLLYAVPFEMTFRNSTSMIETFGIQYPASDFLLYTRDMGAAVRWFANKVRKREASLFSNTWGSIDSNVQRTIHQLLHCPFREDLRSLYFQYKSMELLLVCINAYHEHGSKSSLYLLHPGDKEKIIAARDLISERLDTPPSFREIASAVGLNEYKLKTGFRQLFGTTPFKYQPTPGTRKTIPPGNRQAGRGDRL